MVSTGSSHDRPVPHPIRGALLALLLGPLFIAGVVIAATGLISSFIAGWLPSQWFSANAADWLFGSGVQGDGVNYIRFMLGGLLAAGTGAAIRWGFLGDSQQR